MTYFDIKDVVFVNKIANCRKKCKRKGVCVSRKTAGFLEDFGGSAPQNPTVSGHPRSPSGLPYL